MTAVLRRYVAPTAVLAAVALTVVGCTSRSNAPTPKPTAPPASTAFPSSQPLPSGSAGTLPVRLPAPSAIDNVDATTVSQAVVTIQWTVDTTTDTSQYQAELRSTPFLTGQYLTALKANPPVAAPGAQWNEWARHRAYTTVATRAEHDDQPADTPTQALRQWGITVTPHGRDGWTGTPTTATVFVTMSRASSGSPWRVSAINVSS